MTTPTGRRWLVITKRLSGNEPRIYNVGCVRAETITDAYYKGCELLNEQTVDVIALANIDDRWKYSEED